MEGRLKCPQWLALQLLQLFRFIIQDRMLSKSIIGLNQGVPMKYLV